MSILITGRRAFIGSSFVHERLAQSGEDGVQLDQPTDAGNLTNLSSLRCDMRHVFLQGDVSDQALVKQLFADHQARVMINFVAGHLVDRSVFSSETFIKTNGRGTFRLPGSAPIRWNGLLKDPRTIYRFVFASTDEAYAAFSLPNHLFAESNRTKPNNPYSASMAANNSLERAWNQIFGILKFAIDCNNNDYSWNFSEMSHLAMIIIFLAAPPCGPMAKASKIATGTMRQTCKSVRRVLEVGQAGKSSNAADWNGKTNFYHQHAAGYSALSTTFARWSKWGPPPIRSAAIAGWSYPSFSARQTVSWQQALRADTQDDNFFGRDFQPYYPSLWPGLTAQACLSAANRHLIDTVWPSSPIWDVRRPSKNRFGLTSCPLSKNFKAHSMNLLCS